MQLPPPAVFHDKYQWEIWKNTAGKSASPYWPSRCLDTCRGPQCFSINIVFKHCLHLPFLAVQTRDALSQHLPWFSLFPMLPNPILSLPCHPCVKPVQISRGRVPSAWGRRSLQFALIRNYNLGSFSLFFASETFLHNFDSRAEFFSFSIFFIHKMHLIRQVRRMPPP